MERLNLVICVNSSEESQYRYFERLYHFFNVNFNIDNELPSLMSIICSRHTYYLVSKTVRKFSLINFFKFKLIRLLNKSYNEKCLVKALFICDVKTEFIVIVPQIVNIGILLEHFTEDFLDKCAWNCILNPLNKDKLNNLESFVNKLVRSSFYKVNEDFRGSIIVYNSLYTDILKELKHKYPNAKLIFKFIDVSIQLSNQKETLLEELYSSEFSKDIKSALSFLKNYGFDVCTYSKIESDFYNIRYEPNGVNFNKLRFITKINKCGDWFYCGFADCNRYRFLLNLIKSLVSCNINAFFVLVGLSEAQKAEIKSIAGIDGYVKLSFNKIPYNDYINYFINSPVVIDLFRLYPDEGYSYRIAEALASNKNVITNRTVILKEAFYTKQKILFTENFILSENELLPLSISDGSIYNEDSIVDFDIHHQLESI